MFNTAGAGHHEAYSRRDVKVNNGAANPVCPHCGGKCRLNLKVSDLNRRISGEVFDYQKCDTCELIFLCPVPADLGRYYPKSYYTLPDSANQLAAWAEHERYKLDIVEKFRKSGRLVEIGPATGGFAFLAKAAGFDVSVIEMSPECCEFLSRIGGIKVTNSSNEVEALRQSEPADVIALWHVIEHLRDPFELISVAAGRLRPGGVLIIAAPNPTSLQFRLLRSAWTHVDAPRHLYLVPMEVMHDVLAAHGMERRLVTTLDPGSVGWNAFGWEYSLVNLAPGKMLKRVARRIARLATRLFGPFERVEGKGSAYTLVYQRRDD